MTSANPQGKGLVPVLRDWSAAQPSAVRAKSPQVLLAEYFTSLLVLSADFGFQPRQDVRYHLYRSKQRWHLSLISPGEWGAASPGSFLGNCTLLEDMTWKLEVREDLQSQPELLTTLRQFHEGFMDHLRRADFLEETLPFYAAGLPYYQRLLAAGLASSISTSMSLAGTDKASGQRWLSAFLTATDRATASALDRPTQEYSGDRELAFFPSY